MIGRQPGQRQLQCCNGRLAGREGQIGKSDMLQEIPAALPGHLQLAFRPGQPAVVDLGEDEPPEAVSGAPLTCRPLDPLAGLGVGQRVGILLQPHRPNLAVPVTATASAEAGRRVVEALDQSLAFPDAKALVVERADRLGNEAA